MEFIGTLGVLALAATPLALLGGWLTVRGFGRLGQLVNSPDSDGWWRSAMPWPTGVQEDDEVHWNLARPLDDEGPPPPRAPSPGPERVPIPPSRPQGWGSDRATGLDRSHRRERD